MYIPTGRAPRSTPQLVMRTGIIRPMSPAHARQDLNALNIQRLTHLPVDQAMPPMLPVPVPPSLAPSPAPTATPAAPLIPAAPGPVTTAVAQAATATPPAPIPVAASTDLPHNPSDRHHWHREHRRMHPLHADIKRLHPHAQLHGAEDVLLGEWNGRPLAKFEIASSPPRGGASQAVEALRQAAKVLRSTGLHLPPELIGGPLAALMRGGAVELHFQNGVVMRATL
jgi:hypothetical protein